MCQGAIRSFGFYSWSFSHRTEEATSTASHRAFWFMEAASKCTSGPVRSAVSTCFFHIPVTWISCWSAADGVFFAGLLNHSIETWAATIKTLMNSFFSQGKIPDLQRMIVVLYGTVGSPVLSPCFAWFCFRIYGRKLERRRRGCKRLRTSENGTDRVMAFQFHT